MRKRLTDLWLLVLMVAIPATADCPTALATNTKGWPAGKPVYYDDSGLPPGAQTDVEGALGDWTNDNTIMNNSGVTISKADATHPANLVFQSGSASGDPAIVKQSNNLDGTLKSATVTIDTSNTSIFDPSQPGYDDALAKTARHEVGHTMGLGDQPIDSTKVCGGQSTPSVMNAKCGVNDQWHNLPSSITYCDNQGVNRNPTYGGAAAASRIYRLADRGPRGVRNEACRFLP